MPLGALRSAGIKQVVSQATIFQEQWNGADNDLWNAANWPSIDESVPSTTTINIQNNQGRMTPQGAAFVSARALSSAVFSNLDLRIQFTFSTSATQFHGLNFRQTGGWSTNNANDPANGFKISLANASWLFVPVTNSVRGSSIAGPARTWGTTTWNLRVQALGSAIKIKTWQGTEPSTWDIETTDASNPSGVIGLWASCGSDSVARPISWDNLTVEAEAEALAAPANVLVPSVTPSGGAIGTTLTTTLGTWTGNPTPTLVRQWKRDGTNVGTDSATYVTAAAGSHLCTITATNSQGSASADSNAVTITAAAADVERFDYIERSVTNSNAGGYSNPYDYTVVELVLVVTRPNATTFTVRGFYAGGSTWKVRIRADTVGSYSYVCGWAGSGSHPAAPSGASFTCGDTGVHRGPIKIATDNSWYFEDGRGAPIHARAYGTHHMLWWTASRNIITEKELMKTRMTTYLADRGYNMTMFNGIGHNVHQSDPIGRNPESNYAMSWWGTSPDTTPDYTRYHVPAFDAFDEVLLHMRDKGIYTYFFTTLYSQWTELDNATTGSKPLSQKLARYIMARWAALFNVFGLSPTWEWMDIWTTSEVNLIMNFVESSDPYGRPLTIHDQTVNSYIWADISMTQAKLSPNTWTVASTNDRRSATLAQEQFADANGVGGVSNNLANAPVLASEWSWMTDTWYNDASRANNTWLHPTQAIHMQRNIWGAVLGGMIPLPDWWNGWHQGTTGSGFTGVPVNLDDGEPRMRILYDFVYGLTRYREYTKQNSLVTGPGNKFCSAIVGEEYLIYGDAGGTISLNFGSGAVSLGASPYGSSDTVILVKKRVGTTTFDVTFLNPATGATQAGSPITIGGGPAWTPASFPGLTNWVSMLRSPDVPASGNLTTWKDMSGSARDWSARTSTTPFASVVPTRVTRPDGKPAAQFASASSNAMRTAGPLSTIIGTGGLVAIVMEMNGTPVAGQTNFYQGTGIFQDFSDAGNDGGYFGITCDSTGPRVKMGIWDGAAKNINITQAASTRFIVLFRRDSTIGTPAIFGSVNGGTETQLASGAPQNSTYPLVLGLRTDAGGSAFLNGWIYEIVCSSGNGSTTDRANLISYLKSEWSI